MSLKSELKTYSYAGEVARFRTQSVVECRLTGVGEISSILATRADAVLYSASAQDKEVQYKGKAVFSIVYEGADRNVCRLERGAEFAHRGQCERCVPACQPYVRLSVLSTSVRREGASFFISCVIEADISLTAVKAIDYVAGGEGLICKSQPQKAYREERVGGELEIEDQFDCELLSDVLLHSEEAGSVRATAETGAVVVEGEVAVRICAVKAGTPDTSERLLPFKVEIPCDGASVGDGCTACVSVAEATLSDRCDEEKGRSTLSLTVRLSVSAVVMSEEEMVCVQDAYSTESDVLLTEGRERWLRPVGNVRFTERVGGVCALSDGIDFTTSFQALVCQKAEAEVVCTESGEEIQGVVSAVLLVCDSDGAHRGIGVQLPYSLPLRGEFKEKKTVSALVCGMSVRQKKEGEAEVEATLKFSVDAYEERFIRYLSEVAEGEKIQPPKGAFGVFLPREGDELWDIAKSLHRPAAEVAAGNPDLTFPVKKGERIVVYRRKS